MTKITTGSVFTRTVKGGNFIALGKALDADGNEVIIATKNGNIRLDGQAKLGHKVKTIRSNAKNAPAHHLGKKGNRMVLQAFLTSEISSIHGQRNVKLDTIFDRGQAEDVGVEVKVISKRGLNTPAKQLS